MSLVATARTGLDLREPGFVADPYPEPAALRRLGPVVHHEPTGMLLAATHDAVSQTLRHRGLGRLWRDREPADELEPFNTLHRNQMMENEPPVHTRLRRLVGGAFGRGHVERMRPRIVALADELLDRLHPARAGGTVDVVASYAEPLPVAVIADLLGVPPGDRGQLREWSQAMVRMYEYHRPAAVEAAAVRASADFAAYVRDLAAHRRRHPGDDLLTDLAGTEDGGLSDDELVASVVLLLNAGHEASVNAFGNGLVALLRSPDQLARVVAREVPVDVAVDELLRHDPPLQLFERTATRDVELAGTPVAAGTKVAALLGSANRDDVVFARPDQLDVGRDPNPHVGFGMGVHFCLGAPLARLELCTALERLLTRWPTVRLAGEPVRRPAFVLRGYREITVDPREAAVSHEHDAVDVIRAKRDGSALDDDQIDWVVDAYTRGAVADEQMSALAMAILLNGMGRREVARWTAAMIASGERLDFSALSRPTVDKHSTGGVGDKITLPLAPLVAACGVAVPQLSGRGLGHTGGTLDKLESIPGWRAALSTDEMMRQLEDVGSVICAAGSGLAPADKKLYALRDVTGTVESIPLIASSIMSKKIAEGTGALVLDVKVGSGAFMKELTGARELAETMVALGADEGVRTVALLSDMATPLGRTAGNALEARESVEVLAGGGPDDVVELTLAIAREMLAVVGVDEVYPADRLADGSAMDVWRRVIAAQGGDPDADLPEAKETFDVVADRDGVLERLDALAVGVAAWRLGAGRATQAHAVQAAAGVVLHAKPGDTVRAGQPLLTLHTDTADRFDRATAALDGAWTITPDGPEPRSRATPILDRIAS